MWYSNIFWDMFGVGNWFQVLWIRFPQKYPGNTTRGTLPCSVWRIQCDRPNLPLPLQAKLYVGIKVNYPLLLVCPTWGTSLSPRTPYEWRFIWHDVGKVSCPTRGFGVVWHRICHSLFRYRNWIQSKCLVNFGTSKNRRFTPPTTTYWYMCALFSLHCHKLVVTPINLSLW